MRISEFFIVNILSDKLQGVIVERRNGTTVVRYRTERYYAGFYDGTFLDERGIREEMETLLSDLKKNARITIKNILIGVPGEFTSAVVRNPSIDFGQPKRITDKDTEFALHNDKAARFNNDYVTVNASPISYSIDNKTGLKTVVGEVSSKLICKASYILAEKEFTALFDSVAEDNDINFTYISALLSEINFILTENERDSGGVGVLFVDLGYISSSVAIAMGDGILFSVSFPEGEGSVAAEINAALDIPFEHALELVRKLNFNLENGEDDCFTISDNGKIYRYRMTDVLEHAYLGLKKIAAYLLEVLARVSFQLPSITEPVYMTGSKFLGGEGVIGILESEIGRPIELVKSHTPDFDEYDSTSLAGISEFAVRLEKESFKMRIKRLFLRT